MVLGKRINAFAELGKFLGQFCESGIEKKDNVLLNDLFFDAVKLQINRASEFNSWFTKDNVLYAIESWTKLLNKKTLTEWTSAYNLENNNPKTIAVIMAGNIPLVGFHDFLSVLISDNNILIKQSSNDKHLLPLLAKYLEYVEPEFKGKINFTEGKLTDFDATIATGSNNTARYFEYYFGNKPHIIRNNRNSVAVLTGNENPQDLKGIGEDIFRYFGLGCRSVSKLFVPKGYNFDLFFNAIYDYHDIINYKKYENNYDYNKAVYLMSEFDILENGFFMIKEDTSYSSPIATAFYEYYNDLESLKLKLKADTEQIQCVVSNTLKNTVNFGETQQPSLMDYADGVDTLKFLSKL
ncbi:acyl-CoA reductase [Aureibaculum sp. 2210JD6-5]|uniref:acyl-CoA reductase n=1 Tax=Aureibaculum sp. 2210JD6-5 TaxID=3103957 RepID=UPI002AAE542F|nr:acyl-CoA reductase [Aureibaculum sp. 2210JD6-5]MDY7393633.1 acyl-CoA reductase [Aureibaculum sp. 2210JD6-5]